MSDTAVNVVAIWANDGELLTKAAAEIERLREAIKMACECLEDVAIIDAHQILIKALGEKG